MRELTVQDRGRLDDLHLQVRRETDLQRQLALVDQIAEILDYPRVDPRGPWGRQLVQFICAGTDEESTWAGSVQGKQEAEALALRTPPEGMVMGEVSHSVNHREQPQDPRWPW